MGPLFEPGPCPEYRAPAVAPAGLPPSVQKLPMQILAGAIGGPRLETSGPFEPRPPFAPVGLYPPPLPPAAVLPDPPLAEAAIGPLSRWNGLASGGEPLGNCPVLLGPGGRNFALAWHTAVQVEL